MIFLRKKKLCPSSARFVIYFSVHLNQIIYLRRTQFMMLYGRLEMPYQRNHHDYDSTATIINLELRRELPAYLNKSGKIALCRFTPLIITAV